VSGKDKKRARKRQNDETMLDETANSRTSPFGVDAAQPMIYVYVLRFARARFGLVTMHNCPLDISVYFGFFNNI